MSRKVLDQIKKTYADSPRGVGGYYQEYELQVQSTENALWRREHIKYHDGEYKYSEGQNYLGIDGDYIPVNTFIGCDPATDIDTKDSDYSVILAIAVDAANNVYVLEYERHRSIPTMALRDESGEIQGKPGVVDHIVRLYEKYHAASGTVEDVAMTRSVLQDLNAYKAKWNKWNISIIPEKPGGLNKVNRIYTSLNHRFSGGQIYIREGHLDLEDEIIKFGPKLAHDDVVDALYYACRYCYPHKGGKYDEMTGRVGVTKKRRAKSWVVA
jgi:phage terminase large subunit-like protein